MTPNPGSSAITVDLNFEIPAAFDDDAREYAQDAIDDAFVVAFRNGMLLSGALALLSALVSFVLIRPVHRRTPGDG